MTGSEDSLAIETFFKAGISVEDLPALFPLLRAREALHFRRKGSPISTTDD